MMDTHTPVDIVMSLLVLCGSFFLLASILAGQKATRHIPGALLGRWRFMMKLMNFFLAGYLLLAVTLISSFTIPLSLIAAPVFFAGAVFVYIVINLTRETINRIKKQAEDSCHVLNESLEQRVVERTSELEQSHTFLKTVLGSLHDEVMIIDAKTCAILGANAVFLANQGVREEAIIGRRCHAVVHNQQHVCMPPYVDCPLFETVETGKHAVAEHTHVDESGNKHYVEISTTPVRDGDGPITRIIHASRDITERKAAEEAVRESEERYRRLVELSPEGISIQVDGKFALINPAGVRMLGASHPDQLIGMSSLDVVHPAFKEVVESRIRHLEENAGMQPWLEEKYVRLDGVVIDVETAVVGFTYEGKPAVQAIFRDVTERKLMARRIEHIAFYDQLTELPNRALFFDRLNQVLALAKRNQKMFALLYMDLDDCKAINDTLGHEAGDQLLQEASQRMTSTVRKSDTIARMGGDEFIGICCMLTAPEDAGVVAQKIIAALSEPYDLKGRCCTIGVSIGISLYPKDGEDGETLVNKADHAMYRVKGGGKGGYLSYGDC
jgi:diguanylate cyclase (GGDEF)-like protein/PAS domain S-box-containing protein